MMNGDRGKRSKSAIKKSQANWPDKKSLRIVKQTKADLTSREQRTER